MPELEIHHEGQESDPMGQKVGVLAAILAVVLGVVTISSHRAHTEGIILKTEANDKWQFYQAKSLKSHNLTLGEDLLTALGAKGEASEHVLSRYKSEKTRYEHESKEIREQAEEKEKESSHVELQALRYDLGEGLLEIALVLSSLYFISRKMLFPVIGLISGGIGAVIALTGYLLH